VCYVQPKEVIFQPCNHLAVCSSCDERLETHGKRECIICRNPIESSTRVYTT
jgi:hypothetical protein